MLVEKIAQAVADSVYLACLDWLLPVPVHAFVSASETVLKALVAEVTGGHRIVARIQNIPRSLRAKQDFTIP